MIPLAAIFACLRVRVLLTPRHRRQRHPARPGPGLAWQARRPRPARPHRPHPGPGRAALRCRTRARRRHPGRDRHLARDHRPRRHRPRQPAMTTRTASHRTGEAPPIRWSEFTGCASSAAPLLLPLVGCQCRTSSLSLRALHIDNRPRQPTPAPITTTPKTTTQPARRSPDAPPTSQNTPHRQAGMQKARIHATQISTGPVIRNTSEKEKQWQRETGTIEGQDDIIAIGPRKAGHRLTARPGARGPARSGSPRRDGPHDARRA